MAVDYHETFSKIIAKANLLAERYDLLAKSKREVDDRLKSLTEQIEAKDKELQKLKSEVEYLRLAATITPNREQIEEARAIISGLVRDIDRCIADITE